MKKTIRLIGIIAIAALIGISFAACGGDDNGGGNGGGGGGGGSSGAAKRITITGYNANNSGVNFSVIRKNDEEMVAWNYSNGTQSGNSITIELFEKIFVPWTGSGHFVLYLHIVTGPDEGPYYYTEGKSWTTLGISGNPQFNIEKLPTYNIQSATSTIPLSQFTKYP